MAEDLIDRFKGLFSRKFSIKENDGTASTVAIVNGVKVEAFPSHHVDTMRGLDNVKFIYCDESDFFPSFQQTEVRAVMEGYIGKPNVGGLVKIERWNSICDMTLSQIEKTQKLIQETIAKD